MSPVGAIDYALGSDRPRTRPAAPAEASTGLTKREWEIAVLVAQGYTNRQIAEELCISVRTAEGHVERIRSKLGFASRAKIAAWVAGKASSPPVGTG